MPRADVAASDQLVPDLIEVPVPVGGRVLVASDLHFSASADATSERVAAELARTVQAWAGPGAVVLAGDAFELLGSGGNDPSGALRAHPRLVGALAAFADGPDRRVVVLPGNHDGALAWHPAAVRALQTQLHAQVAIAADLVIATGSGERRVRVEHGHQLDPSNAFADPRNPGETPLGHHVVREVLPMTRERGAEWLDGLELLVDSGDAGAFVGSRLTYRRLARRALTLVVPFVLSGVLAIASLLASGSAADDLATAALVTLIVAASLVVAVVVGGLWWLWAVGRPLSVLRTAALTGTAGTQNDAPRRRAGRLVGDGLAGYITGHTHEPELTDLGGGFYANSGCGGEVAERRRGWLGLPDAFSIGRRISWVELEAGADLRVELHCGRQSLPTTTTIERVCTRRLSAGTATPVAVASWPHGASWPQDSRTDGQRRNRARRVGAVLLAAAGIIDLLSAITPPVFDQLARVTNVFPLAVPQTAAVIVVVSGIALLLLARGVRRGQRHAWAAAIGLLLVTSVLHLLKGLDIAESVIAIVTAVYLWSNGRYFRTKVDESSVVKGLLTLLVGGVAAIAGGMIAVMTIGGDERPSLGEGFVAVSERLVGIGNVDLPNRVDRFLEPTLLATSIGLAVAAGWLLFRPVLARSLAARPPEAIEQARRLVERYGGDTLSYFALRDDKRFWFWGDTLVAYAVHQGVCLVSPDPIGPKAEQREAWAAFRAFADDHGWPVAVMGAGEGWLPIYEASDMRDLYVGDEAVVDVRRFDLSGGRNKGLRQAVNRIAKYGYRAEFHDPSALDPALEARLRRLMTESRHGEVERGFSMTLGRIFDPDDKGLLLTVCFGPDDEPVAFCQYVPATGIDGYSLDLMRRSEGQHPNGLTDFVVVETIQHLREQGKVGLGLNFATIRAVLAGERGDGSLPRVQKWFLQKMGDSMQIESLWRFNAKFDPDWVPRHAVYDAAENFMTAALAVAKAESFWEIPVIGRFLVPSSQGTLPAAPDVPDGEQRHEALGPFGEVVDDGVESMPAPVTERTTAETAPAPVVGPGDEPSVRPTDAGAASDGSTPVPVSGGATDPTPASTSRLAGRRRRARRQMRRAGRRT